MAGLIRYFAHAVAKKYSSENQQSSVFDSHTRSYQRPQQPTQRERAQQTVGTRRCLTLSGCVSFSRVVLTLFGDCSVETSAPETGFGALRFSKFPTNLRPIPCCFRVTNIYSVAPPSLSILWIAPDQVVKDFFSTSLGLAHAVFYPNISLVY